MGGQLTVLMPPSYHRGDYSALRNSPQQGRVLHELHSIASACPPL